MSNSQIDEEMNSDTEISHNSKPSKKQDPKSKEPSKDKKIILDEKTFNECKNLMRPVKKALKNIDVKDGKIEKEDFERVKRHLLEIGDKINDHLTKYSDANKIKEWRNNLWIFVSKFTTMSYDRLKQLYIKFASTRDQEEINKQMTSSISSGGNSGNNNSSNRYNSATSHNNSSSYNKYNNNNEHKQRSSNSDFWKNEKYFDTKHKNYNNSLSNNYSNNSSSNRHSFSNYNHASFDHDNFNHSFNGFDSYPDNHDHKKYFKKKYIQFSLISIYKYNNLLI
jgi:chromodomain-helicase-DNA-binding protein 1